MKEQLSLPASALIFVPITFFFGVLAASFSVIAFLLVAFVGRILPRLRTRPQAEDKSRLKSPEKEDESKKETKTQRTQCGDDSRTKREALPRAEGTRKAHDTAAHYDTRR